MNRKHGKLNIKINILKRLQKTRPWIWDAQIVSQKLYMLLCPTWEESPRLCRLSINHTQNLKIYQTMATMEFQLFPKNVEFTWMGFRCLTLFTLKKKNFRSCKLLRTGLGDLNLRRVGLKSFLKLQSNELKNFYRVVQNITSIWSTKEW